MIRIELLCREIKRLTDDYYKCENTVIKEQIYQDVKLLSEGLFLSELPDYMLDER
ncbi:hypothetical protein ACN6MY_05690 [Peribacillus sp. B-H-3]|jgi:hypothetical protein|uniref:hypothetical protein n=1 Tax=Peribacillus sp. B-H-3 TaxID=3400420 RepID=UPI003B01A60C